MTQHLWRACLLAPACALIPACGVIEKHELAMPMALSERAPLLQGRRVPVWAPAGVIEKHELSLPAVFSDHAVFQQGREIPVWGTAEPGKRVVVRFAGQKKGAVAGDHGRWLVRLDPVAAGGPHELRVSVGLKTVERTDILVGEVWVCSGQSNMAWPLSRAKDAAKEVILSDYPEIRLLSAPRTVAQEPAGDLEAEWVPCTSETAPGFSAVAYFFGRYLHRRLGVPVGLIHASWGGSRAESWTPRSDLELDPNFAPLLAQWDARYQALLADETRRPGGYEKAMDRYRRDVAAFRERLGAKDRGLQGRWYRADLDANGWKTMTLPTAWEQGGLAGFDGVVWFRREVTVPAEWAGSELLLEWGPIDDDDETYFNGTKVGATGYGQANSWRVPRKYRVPGRLVKGGRNVIACRVLDGSGSGGIYGQARQMKLVPQGVLAGGDLSLAGAWTYRVGCALGDEKLPQAPRRPGGARNVGFMYNGMIAPLVPYGIAGVIWYQGESNAGQPAEYARLFPTMIRGWRRRWKQGDFAFLFVQLANYMAPAREPDEGGWAWVREAQVRALDLPMTAMVATIDIGEAADIHPRNKQDVGRRLALAALAKVHRRDVVYSGPVADTMAVEGNKVRIRFKHIGAGLLAKGASAPALKHFAVAGEDRQWVWAEARVAPAADGSDPDTVVVWSDRVAKPVAVRYAWASNPEGCNLYNLEGLPAVPFRTDDWPRAAPLAGP